MSPREFLVDQQKQKQTESAKTLHTYHMNMNMNMDEHLHSNGSFSSSSSHGGYSGALETIAAAIKEGSESGKDKDSIQLLNQEVGSITRFRLCQFWNGTESGDGDGDLDLGQQQQTTKEKQCTMPNNGASGIGIHLHSHSPVPVHVQSWMNNGAFQGYQSILLYDTGEDFRVLGQRKLEDEDEESGHRRSDAAATTVHAWHSLDVTLNFSDHACASLHNPSIVANDQERKLYM